MQNIAKENHLQHWSEERYHELQQQLSTLYQDGPTELVITHHKLSHIRCALVELRQKVVNCGFNSPEEEIRFIKHILPLFSSQQYLYSQWLQVLSRLPKGNSRLVLQHYLGFLRQAEHFFHNHYPLYQYYQLELSESDPLYFIRGINTESTLHLPLVDAAFSTPVSELFAQFMAMDTLRSWLLQRISDTGSFPVLNSWQEPFSGRRLHWTGSHVNLVELVYGLFYTGQLNSGAATLQDITRLMEDVFQVELPGVHRSFHDIRNRKILTSTNFLDEMRKRIMERVDQDLAYDPAKKRSTSV